MSDYDMTNPLAPLLLSAEAENERLRAENAKLDEMVTARDAFIAEFEPYWRGEAEWLALAAWGAEYRAQAVAAPLRERVAALEASLFLCEAANANALLAAEENGWLAAWDAEWRTQEWRKLSVGFARCADGMRAALAEACGLLGSVLQRQRPLPMVQIAAFVAKWGRK